MSSSEPKGTAPAPTKTSHSKKPKSTLTKPRGVKMPRGVQKDQITKKKPKVHSFFVNSAQFVIDSKYNPLNPIGHGAYGVVCSATDVTNDKKVAIKKIPKAFEDLIDAKRIIREVKLLRHFKHDNVCGLYDLIDPPSMSNFDDVYMVLEYMETDLHKIIYSKNKLSDDHIQYFMYQILRGLKYIHSAKVIHRDLKPSNILLNGNCDLKICDFGLARGVDDEDIKLTEYVVTRWYRAPEVMCSCREYDQQLDVWSAGCIMAELHGREPLFPGQDYIQQMNLIFEVLGTPSKEDMLFITNNKALEYIKGMESKKKVPLKHLYPNANPIALDLMEKMLAFNPNKRITVEEALDHEYFKSLRIKETEVKCDKSFTFEFEKMKLTEKNLQKCMWDEIALFRPYINNQKP